MIDPVPFSLLSAAAFVVCAIAGYPVPALMFAAAFVFSDKNQGED